MGHLLIAYFASDPAQEPCVATRILRRDGAAVRDPSQRTPIMGEPTFPDRMKRIRETAQPLQKTETPENTVSYRPPEWRLRRSVWSISM